MKLDFDFTFNLRAHVKIILFSCFASSAPSSGISSAFYFFSKSDDMGEYLIFSALFRLGSLFTSCECTNWINIHFKATGRWRWFSAAHTERMNSSQLFSAFSEFYCLTSWVGRLLVAQRCAVSLLFRSVSLFLWLVNEIYEISVASDRSSLCRTHSVYI